MIIPIQDSHLKLGIHFWQTVFGKLLNSIGIGEPSRKSVSNFVKSIQKCVAQKNSNWKCNIKKNIQVTMKIAAKDEKCLVMSINI